MNSFLDAVTNQFQGSALVLLFLDTALKSFVVLTLAGVWCLGWRRASASTRHWIWFLALASLPCLPLLSLALPSWHRPLWSMSTRVSPGNEVSLTLQLAPGAAREVATVKATEPARVAGDFMVSGIKAGRGQSLGMRFDARWLFMAWTAWLAGVFWVLLSMAAGRWQLHQLFRRARLLEDASWLQLGREACADLGLRRGVTFLHSAQNIMPATWGWWRPVVLLPADAQQWPTERRRVVLWHELAHIKRRDCLTQMIARMVGAFFWFNPLVWLAAQRMCIERERACDDLVLRGGCKASDYASHLVEIARTFRRVPQAAAIAMARSSQLAQRVAAIVDASRPRRPPRALLSAALSIVGLGLVAAISAQKIEVVRPDTDESKLLREQQIARLQAFSAAKEKQARAFAAQAGEQLLPEFKPYFDAATSGDWQTVSGLYQDFHKRHPQYEESTGDTRLSVSYWSPMLEIALAYNNVIGTEPRYVQIAVDDIINSIPRDSIYFGGTDPGRGLITAFCKSHADADPFFTLTQNALVDSIYLEYLKRVYGGRIYTPTSEDSKRCFDEYLQDAQRRLEHDTRFPEEPRQIKPGENLKTVEGRAQVTGQVAAMAINARLAKVIFDKNPQREFYIEESFPLEWMYPQLSPNGLIMKINRQRLAELSEEILAQDRRYWTELVGGMIGNWLQAETSVQTITEFAEKVHIRQDLAGFTGDRRYVRNDYAQKMFSKFRSSIAGMYQWRIAKAGNPAQQQRMIRESDFAFRQAFAICPYSPEAVFRYINLLVSQNRADDAVLVAAVAAKLVPENKQFENLLVEVKKIRGAGKP